MTTAPTSELRNARVCVRDLAFPEGPRWRNGSLWYTDIHGHRVYRLDPGSEPLCVAELDDRTSALGFLPDGRAIVVSMLDRRLLAIEPDGGPSIHADLADLSGQFINDMVVDRTGRAYVGSRNGEPPERRSDGLIRVDPDGRARIEVAGMASPNGAVITSDGRSLIVAETAFGRLLRFAIHPDGSLAEREVVFERADLHIDGICLDAAGGFWAGGGIHGLLRISPGFALDRVIEFPGRMVLATALGGSDGRTLFAATASRTLLENLGRVGLDRTLDAGVGADGRIEAFDVDIPAAAEPR